MVGLYGSPIFVRGPTDNVLPILHRPMNCNLLNPDVTLLRSGQESRWLAGGRGKAGAPWWIGLVLPGFFGSALPGDARTGCRDRSRPAGNRRTPHRACYYATVMTLHNHLAGH